MHVVELLVSVIVLLAFLVFAYRLLINTGAFSDEDFNPHCMSDRWRGEREFTRMRRAK